MTIFRPATAQRKGLFGSDGVFGAVGVDDPLTEKSHAILVSSLYARPAALALGAVSGVLSAMAAAHLSGHPLLFLLACLLAAIAFLRIVNASHLRKCADHISTAKLELAYKIRAFAFSGTLGSIAATCVALELSTMVQILLIANALGYGIGICAHNAGRPGIALGELALVSLPICVAAIWLGTPASIVLALNIALLFPVMVAITFSVFRILREAGDAVEKSSELARQMEELALTDPVTGLANRNGLDRRLETMVALAEGTGQVAVFWIDLARFKEINDIHGHQVGDAILREVGGRLKALVDGRAVLSRFGGDEFVLGCPIHDRRSASMLASLIFGEISRPMRIEGERFEISGSVGIAMLPDDGVTVDELMQHADSALYEAKADGTPRIRFFEESMVRSLAHRRDVEEELRQALKRDELSVYFQPIVDLQSGRIRCFEALVRWFHPSRGEIRPDEFIPIAEDCGVIVTLGNWLTERAARIAASWPEDVRLSINLSPLQIKAPGAALGILNAIRDAGLPPDRLELEVTENLFLENSPNIALFISDISRAGVRFALDDFGTGYSSLSYINQWPFSKIKVDRSFISGAQSGLRSDAIIRAVSQMGQALGMEIVAEGLETIEQVRAVRAAGCTLGQGYHFSRAVPDYQAAMLLAEDGGVATEDLRQRLVG